MKHSNYARQSKAEQELLRRLDGLVSMPLTFRQGFDPRGYLSSAQITNPGSSGTRIVTNG
jgi:hypothetical protein